MKKEKLFLALLTTAMATPTTLSLTHSIIPVLATDTELTSMASTTGVDGENVINVDDAKAGTLNFTYKNGTPGQFEKNIATITAPLDYATYLQEKDTLLTITWTPKSDGTSAKTLNKDTDYEISWTASTGKATAKIKFKGGYQGTDKNLAFTITLLNFGETTEVILDDKADYSLASGGVKPSVKKVKVDSVTLPETDYEVSYGANNVVGENKGSITITGKGNCKGKLTKTFDILANTVAFNTKTINGLNDLEKDKNLNPSQAEALATALQADKLQNPQGYSFSIVPSGVKVEDTDGDGKATFLLSLQALKAKPSRWSSVELVLKNLGLALILENGEVADSEVEVMMESEPIWEEMESDFEGVELEVAQNSRDLKIEVNLEKCYKDNSAFDYKGAEKAIKEAIQEKYSAYTLKELTSWDFTPQINALRDKDLLNTYWPIDKPSDLISIELPLRETSTKPVDTTPKPTPTIKPVSTPVAKKTSYRFFNTLTGEHFYTTNEKERDQLLADARWRNEGEGWKSPASSDYPIYRLCNPNTGEHHYTMDRNEYKTLRLYGWNQEGIGFFSASPSDQNKVQLYRLYNPVANDAGSHHYTTSTSERNNLIQQGWTYEGIAWYGLK